MILGEYLRKMRGTTRGSPPRVSNSEIVWSWLGGFLGILAVGWFNQLWFEGTDLTLLIGSFGASAVLTLDGADFYFRGSTCSIDPRSGPRTGREGPRDRELVARSVAHCTDLDARVGQWLVERSEPVVPGTWPFRNPGI